MPSTPTHFRRAAAAATVFVAAAGWTAATGGTASARTMVPWTDQTVFALSPTDSYVAEWMGLSTGWTVIGGPASHVYAGSAGVFATDPSSGDIWEYDGTPNDWTEIGGPGSTFAEGDGHLYGLGPNDAYVAEWNGTPNGWTIIGGPASAIYAGTDGLIATAPQSGTEDVWYYDGTPNSWTDIGGPGWGFAVGASAVYRLDVGLTEVDQWTGGTTWTPILTSATVLDGNPEASLMGIVGGDAGVYVINQDNNPGEQYYKYGGTPNSWSVIGNVLAPIPDVESRTALYGVNYDDSGVAGVDLYSGSGTAWTVIGGPADPALAAGD